MKTRNGKIARLPKEIREELNRLLDDGHLGTDIVAWLNGLPEVQKVTAGLFDGQPINEVNLSQWREGGYADWLQHQQAQEQTRWMIERGREVKGEGGEEDLCEWMAQVASAEMSAQLQQLGAIEDPKERWKLFREILQELWRLRTATSYGQSVGLSREKWQRASKIEDAERQREQRQEGFSKMQDAQGHLEWVMDFMHQPWFREWARTDWPSREEEWRALRRIYGLKKDSDPNIVHPMYLSRSHLEHHAAYNYPDDSK